jgi:hypothetical protein
MKPWNKIATLGSVALLAGLLALSAPAADKDKKDDKEKDKEKPAAPALVVIDGKGKEQKLKTWQFVAGTRRLNWLAPEVKEESTGKDKPPREKPRRPVPQGPEALVFRDENSTVWKDGVLTLIPVDRIRSIDFDAEAETATVKVAGDKPDADVTLTGTTKFKGTNKLTIEAEVDKGELGVADVKYLGGVAKGGIKGVRFPPPKAAAAPAGRPAEVVVNLDETKKATEKVFDVQILYRTAGGEKLSPILFFKKTIKLDVAKVKKLVAAGGEGAEWQVTLKDGTEETFTLLTAGELAGTKVELEGFLARVPAGYKLFPIGTVAEIQFDAAKPEEKEKDKGKDKEKAKEKF